MRSIIDIVFDHSEQVKCATVNSLTKFHEKSMKSRPKGVTGPTAGDMLYADVYSVGEDAG